MNNAYLGGRVSSEVEVQEVGNGKIVANFTLSTKHRDKIDHHRVVAWNEAAKIAALLRRGDGVMIEGRLQSRLIGESREVEVVAWTILPIKGRVEMLEEREHG